MAKNEYRRSLIMLRPRRTGYAGHVRLERRVIMGTLYFIVTAPESAGEMTAVLAGRRGEEYFVAPLGPMRRDRRGQYTLAWSFDPRAIDGRPLDAYALAAVADHDGEGCALVLTGDVEGARNLDMERVQQAVCAALATAREPAADLPEGGEGEDAPDGAAPTQGEPIGRAEEVGPTSDAGQEAGAQALGQDGLIEAAAHVDFGAEEPSENAAQAEQPDRTGDDGTRIFTRRHPVRTQSDAQTAPSEPSLEQRTAAERLGLDVTLPWSEALEPLRALFAARPAIATLEDDYIYVSAPLHGEEDGLRVGLHVTGGIVDGLRYAVPALFTETPPEGLEDWVWVGDDTHGWWVREGEV